MHKINNLNNAWILKGQQVSDLADKMQAAALDDKFSKEDYEKLSNEYDQAVAQRDAAKHSLDIARANQKPANTENDDKGDNPKPVNANKNKLTFANKFVGMMKGDPKIVNEMTSSTDVNGNQIGLTIPLDQQTAIHQLVRQYQSLEPYVNVETVSTISGSRVWEKFQDITPLANLDDETAEIGNNDDPALTLIKYQIHRYAGISTITNTLLQDSAENLMAYLNQWIARKVVVTRNQKILEAVGTQSKKPTISKFDDVIHTLNTSLDPAIAATSTIFTNVSGFDVLSRVKDAKGRYLIQPDVTDPSKKQINGTPVVVVSDRWLHDNAGSHPFIFGDLKQGVTLFDREQMSLLSTNVGAGAFENDTNKVRVIDRFDVKVADDGAFVNGSFKDIPDQAPTAPTSGTGK